MKSSELVFIGIKGSVVALNRGTGELVWKARLKMSDFVNVVMQGGTVRASCYGEIFCLDQLTGRELWHNPLKGFGTGLATIAGAPDLGLASASALAEKRRRDAEADSAAAATASV